MASQFQIASYTRLEQTEFICGICYKKEENATTLEHSISETFRQAMQFPEGVMCRFHPVCLESWLKLRNICPACGQNEEGVESQDDDDLYDCFITLVHHYIENDGIRTALQDNFPGDEEFKRRLDEQGINNIADLLAKIPDIFQFSEELQSEYRSLMPSFMEKMKPTVDAVTALRVKTHLLMHNFKSES